MSWAKHIVKASEKEEEKGSQEGEDGRGVGGNSSAGGSGEQVTTLLDHHEPHRLRKTLVKLGKGKESSDTLGGTVVQEGGLTENAPREEAEQSGAATGAQYLKKNRSDDAILKRVSRNPRTSSLFKDNSVPYLRVDPWIEGNNRPVSGLSSLYMQAVAGSSGTNNAITKLRVSDATPELRHLMSIKDSQSGNLSSSKDDLAVLNIDSSKAVSEEKLTKYEMAPNATAGEGRLLDSGMLFEGHQVGNLAENAANENLHARRGDFERFENKTTQTKCGTSTSSTLAANQALQPAGSISTSRGSRESTINTLADDARIMPQPTTGKKKDRAYVGVPHETHKPRTKEIMNFLKYYAFICSLAIAGLTYTLTFLGPFNYSDTTLLSLKSIWALCWLSPLPMMLLNFLGLITPFKGDKERYRRVNREPRKFDNLYIVVVTRGDNREAAQRSWEAHRHFEQIPKVRVHILTDEPYHFEDTNCLTCPKSFKCNARYKARSLEWYRRSQKLTENDWVLHLDEESIIDPYSLNRCIEFIKYSPHLIGQGIILYNQYDFWKKWIYTAADTIRVGDDLGRFHYQYEVYNKSLVGAHGSFLLINGKVENDVTWELASFTEDYQFAIIATQRKYTCGQIDGIIREQSPQRLIDFLRQRRRWFCGISRTKLFKTKIWTLSWFLGSFSLPIFVTNLCFSIVTKELVPRWIGFVVNFNFSILIVLLTSGSLIESYDAHAGFFKSIIQLLITLLLIPFTSSIESLAVFYAILRPPKSFDVIKK